MRTRNINQPIRSWPFTLPLVCNVCIESTVKINHHINSHGSYFWNASAVQVIKQHFQSCTMPHQSFAVITTTLKGTTFRHNWDVLNTITVTVPCDPPGEDKQNKPQQTNIACRHICVTMLYTHTKSPKHKWWACLHPCGGFHCKLPRENSHKQ